MSAREQDGVVLGRAGIAACGSYPPKQNAPSIESDAHWFNVILSKAAQGDPNYFGVQAPSWTNRHLSTAALIEAKKNTPPEVWAVEYGAEQPRSGGAVFDKGAIMSCALLDEWDDWVDQRQSYRMSLDVGVKNDRSVLVIGKDNETTGTVDVVQVRVWQRTDINQQLREILGVVRPYLDCMHALRVDVGNGSGLEMESSLRDAGVPVVGVRWSSSTKNKAISHTSLLLHRGRFRLPTMELCPALIGELCVFSWLSEPDQHGNRKAGNPAQGAKASNPNDLSDPLNWALFDDHADALMLMASTMSPGGGGGQGVARKTG